MQHALVSTSDGHLSAVCSRVAAEKADWLTGLMSSGRVMRFKEIPSMRPEKAGVGGSTPSRGTVLCAGEQRKTTSRAYDEHAVDFSKVGRNTAARRSCDFTHQENLGR